MSGLSEDRTVNQTFVAKELEDRYEIIDNVFQVRDYAVYLVMQKDHSSYYELIEVKVNQSGEVSLQLWHERISLEADQFEISKEVEKAVQAGFLKKVNL
ncbi:hypothetical protein [Pseudalkalibacillus sp. SCS-8]|uniref:hypothetical protein n=1 Tax=Pseudalkalibacillus nanhaiensis TaxID=3115291 RepID=UPI0032DBC6C3